ncbi:hypothetical protein GHT06_020375 [Daphnia sinensis]|uniref:Retrovirus-related Pol polyprotein from transposon TNT 1-94-like beta-barrel domain-containing protein n=1 Tax=Daphnia sinensis TaxID=1820382 RepID=A0AAD5KJ00_9CRUS|nr:hypothetical protein GHT06_020375 [Daphnia sinensis]
MNEPVPERQILNKILAALPPNFRMVRSAWTVVPVNERTIDNLTRRLVAEESVIASYESESKNETSNAFRAYNHLSIRRSRGGHQAGRGGYPGLRGNLQNARRGAANRYNTAYHHNQRERSKFQNQEFECDLCEVDTHKTADCRKLARARAILKAGKGDNFPNTKNQDSAFPASTSKNQEPSLSDQEMYEEQSNTTKSSHNQDSAFPAAAFFAARSILDWFADSGATQHMTYQKSLLKNYRPVSPGSWTVSGIGETLLDVHEVGDAEVIRKVIVSRDIIIDETALPNDHHVSTSPHPNRKKGVPDPMERYPVEHPVVPLIDSKEPVDQNQPETAMEIDDQHIQNEQAENIQENQLAEPGEQNFDGSQATRNEKIKKDPPTTRKCFGWHARTSSYDRAT